MTTIKDVSKATGVSVATVSRTLRNPEKVSEKTRKRVLAAVAETGYQPNVLARSFRTRTSFVILVLVPNLTNLFYSRVIRGVEKVAAEKGYSVLLGDTGGDINIENRYSEFALTKQVDGVIQLSKRLPKPLKELVMGDPPYPYVNACEFLENRPFPTVGVDNEEAAFNITEYLIKFGHRKIAVITGPHDIPVSSARLEGFMRALKKNGLAKKAPVIAEGDFTLESGSLSTEFLLSRERDFTAIFSFNDEMAMGAVHTLKKKGYKVPKDISIVGFDDIDFARYCDPPLTTVSQPTMNIGKTAAQILFDIMNGIPAERMHVRLPTDLIIRDSVRKN